MTPLPKNLPPLVPMDKAVLQKAFDDWAAETGFVFDETATPQKAREMMLASGVRPEDNILSSELLRMRYPEDYPDES